MTLAAHLLKTYVVSQAVYDAMAEKTQEEIVAADFPADIMDRLVVHNPLRADELRSVITEHAYGDGKINRSQRRKMGALDRRRPKRR